MLSNKELEVYDDETLTFIFENLPTYARPILEQQSKDYTGRILDMYNKLKYRQFESKFYSWIKLNFPKQLWQDYFVDIINYNRKEPMDFGYEEMRSKIKDPVIRSILKNRKLMDAESLCENNQLKNILIDNIEFYIKTKDVSEESKYWRYL